MVSLQITNCSKNNLLEQSFMKITRYSTNYVDSNLFAQPKKQSRPVILGPKKEIREKDSIQNSLKKGFILSKNQRTHSSSKIGQNLINKSSNKIACKLELSKREKQPQMPEQHLKHHFSIERRNHVLAASSHRLCSPSTKILNRIQNNQNQNGFPYFSQKRAPENILYRENSYNTLTNSKHNRQSLSQSKKFVVIDFQSKPMLTAHDAQQNYFSTERVTDQLRQNKLNSEKPVNKKTQISVKNKSANYHNEYLSIQNQNKFIKASNDTCSGNTDSNKSSFNQQLSKSINSAESENKLAYTLRGSRKSIWDAPKTQSIVSVNNLHSNLHERSELCFQNQGLQFQIYGMNNQSNKSGPNVKPRKQPNFESYFKPTESYFQVSSQSHPAHEYY